VSTVISAQLTPSSDCREALAGMRASPQQSVRTFDCLSNLGTLHKAMVRLQAPPSLLPHRTNSHCGHVAYLNGRGVFIFYRRPSLCEYTV
jgi:hypothetical protein